MEFVNTGPLLNEELFDLFLLLASLESQKEWIQVTQEIEDKLEQMYSLTEYQKAEQHFPVPRRSRGLVTYPTFDEAESLAADSVGERSMANCCSRTHNQRITNFHHIYFSDMARSDHSKVLGYRPIHAITRFWRARPVFRTTLISYGAGH